MHTMTWRKTTHKQLRYLAFWTLAWLLTMALASFGPKFIWEGSRIISFLAILLCTMVGAGMILANRTYIKSLDEMQRKITLDAMGLALGVGVVGGLSYSMLDVTNVIPYDAEISVLVVLVSITYLIAIVLGNLRYQ